MDEMTYLLLDFYVLSFKILLDILEYRDLLNLYQLLAFHYYILIIILINFLFYPLNYLFFFVNLILISILLSIYFLLYQLLIMIIMPNLQTFVLFLETHYLLKIIINLYVIVSFVIVLTLFFYIYFYDFIILKNLKLFYIEIIKYLYILIDHSKNTVFNIFSNIYYFMELYE